MLYELFRFCINVFIVYIVFLIAKDIARILFGSRQARHTKPPVVVQPHPEQKQPYQDVQDAKFTEK